MAANAKNKDTKKVTKTTTLIASNSKDDKTVNDIIIDPFLSSAYYRSFPNNIFRKLLGLFILLINIVLLIFVLFVVLNLSFNGKIPFADTNLPLFIKNNFLLLKDGKTTWLAYLLLWGGVVTLILDIVYIFVIFSFSSMRRHVKVLESSIL